jgi:hypothetical protein
MTRTRHEVVFTRKGEKPWIETDKVAVVFRDGRGQVVKPDLAGATAPLLEGMHVTPNKTRKALAMGKLQEHLATVAID